MKYLRLILAGLLLVLGTIARCERVSSFAADNHELDDFEESYNAGETEEIHSFETNNAAFDSNAEPFPADFDTQSLPLDETSDVQFTPTSLTFKDCPLSITVAKEFVMFNSMTSPVVVFGMKSDNKQFHPTLTQQIEIPPGETYSVRIIYLPYRVETIAVELTILTSRGEYRFPITANAILNPYRINPQLGIRFPAGGSLLEKPIIVYNPHAETLHITEIFTTEPFLTLKDAGVGSNRLGYPTSSTDTSEGTGGAGISGTGNGRHNKLQGKTAADGAPPEIADYSDGMWMVPPGAEKEVIVLSVSTDLKPGNHNGFLHIKTDHDNIVMPVELQILSSLVYPQHEELLFGTLTSPSERKSLDLLVKNNGPTAVHVTEIIPVEPDENLVIELAPHPVVYPGELVTSRVAKLLYSGIRSGTVNNKLLVVTNNTNAASAVFEVRYGATVLHGGVRFEHAQTLFFVEVHNKSYIPPCHTCDLHGVADGFDWRKSAEMLNAHDAEVSRRAAALSDPSDGSTETDNSEGGSHYTTVDTSTWTSWRPTDHPELLRREIKLTNYFDAPVALLDAQFTSCGDIFSTDFRRPTVQEVAHPVANSGVVVDYMLPWKPIQVFLKRAVVYGLYRENNAYLPRTCHLDVTTNVTTHRVALHIVTGALSIDYMDVPMIQEFEPYVLDDDTYRAATAHADAIRYSTTPTAVTSTITRTGTSTGTGADGGEGETAVALGLDNVPTVSPPVRDRFTDLNADFPAKPDHSPTRLARLFNCAPDSICLDSMSNSDVYHIDLGNQSLTEPKTLRVVLANHNPIPVSMRLAEASHDVCACAEGLWTISPNDATIVEPILAATRHRSWADATQEAERCFCLAPTLSSPRNPADSEQTQAESEQQPRGVTAYTTDVNQNVVFSIVLRDLSRCHVHPVKLLGFSSTPMSECRSPALIKNGTDLVEDASGLSGVRLSNDERSTVRLELHTDLQRLQLHLHFRAKTARLHTRIAPPGIDRSHGGRFVMGLPEPLTLRTRSGFQEPLRDLKLSVAPSTLYRLDFDQSVATSATTRTWHTGLHMMSVCSDRATAVLQNGSLGAGKIDEPPRTSQSVWRCAYNLIHGLNYTDPFRVALMNALRKQEGFMNKGAPASSTTVSPQSAFEASMRLKDTWLNAFPHGLPLPPAVVYMDAAQTTHAYRIENATLQPPVLFTPHAYTLQMPPARVGYVHWFYLHVSNPYETHVAFSLADESASETSKRMRALGGLYFQPSGLEASILPRITPVASKYHCSGVSVGTNGNVPVSRTPIPCECRTFKRPSEAYCEVDLSGPVELSGTVDEATVWRSRALSVVQSAVGYSSASSMLAGLNKLFAPDIETGTVEGAISGTSSSPAGSSSATGSAPAAAYNLPFLPQSTVASVWSIPPRGTARIGPFIYAPRVATPASGPEKSSFYIFNNFTGYERVDIYTSSGVAALSVTGVARCAAEPGAASAEDVAQYAKDDAGCLKCVNGQWLESATPVSDSSEQKVDIAVDTLGQPYRVRVRNTGSVPATLHSVSLDGVSCRAAQSRMPSATAVPSGWWQTALSVLFPPVLLSADPTELAELCAGLPIELQPDAELEGWVKAPSSCEYARVKRRLIFHLDEVVIESDGSGDAKKAAGATTDPAGSQLVVNLHYQLSPAAASDCLFESSGGWGSTLLWTVAILVTKLVLWQMVSLYCLVRQQHLKYTSAKHAKGKRHRSAAQRRLSGGNLGGSGSPGGTASGASGALGGVASPAASRLFSASQNDIAARMGYTVSPAGTTVDAAEASDHQGDGIDLTDVIVATAQPSHDANGSASNADGAVSEVRPKMRAVEALLAQRNTRSLPTPSPPRSPPKLTVHTAFTVVEQPPASTAAAIIVPNAASTTTEGPALVFEEIYGEGLSSASTVAVGGDLDKRSPLPLPPPGFGFSSGQTSAETQAGSLAVLTTSHSQDREEGGTPDLSQQDSALPSIDESPALSSASSQVFDTSSGEGSSVSATAQMVAEVLGNDTHTMTDGPIPVAERVVTGTAAAKGAKAAAKANGNARTAAATTVSADPPATVPAKKARDGKSAKKGTAIHDATAVEVKSGVNNITQPTQTTTKGQAKQKGAAKQRQNLVATSLVPSVEKETVTLIQPLKGGEPDDSAGFGSPLRLQTTSMQALSSASEDSPLFRYSGQLLDPTRESHSALDTLLQGLTPGPSVTQPFLPHFPVGVTGATSAAAGRGGVAPSLAALGSLSQDSSVKTAGSSLLAPNLNPTIALSEDLDEALRAVKSTKDSLTIDIGLDLALPSTGLPSPQDILAAGTTSELRVTADPFYSSAVHSASNSARLRSDSGGGGGFGRARADSSSGNSYLNDLLATAQAAAHTALDTSTDNATSFLGYDDGAQYDWLGAGRSDPGLLGADQDLQASYYAELSGADPTDLQYQSLDQYSAGYDDGYFGGYNTSGKASRDYAEQGEPYADRYMPQQQYYDARGGGFYDGRSARGGVARQDRYGIGAQSEYQRNSGPYFDRVDRHTRRDRHDSRDHRGRRQQNHHHQQQPVHHYSTLQPQHHNNARGAQGAGIGMRQRSGSGGFPDRHYRPAQSHYEDNMGPRLTAPSLDFLDDQGLEADAGSWVQSLTQQGDGEHHSFPHRGGGEGGRASGQQAFGGAPGLSVRSMEPSPEQVEQGRYAQDVLRGGPQLTGYGSRHAPQQQSHPQHPPQTGRHQRLLQPQAGALTGAPGLQTHRQNAATGFNPFARPEPSVSAARHSSVLSASPSRGASGLSAAADLAALGEHDTWLTLNSPGTALIGLRGSAGPGENGLASPESRPVALGTPVYAPEYPSLEADAAAAELQFFHPNSFFGESALGGMELEALEPLGGLLEDESEAEN